MLTLCTLYIFMQLHISNGFATERTKLYKKGLAIFISESAGMEASGDGPLNYEEWQKWIDWMEARGLSWITWSVSDKDESCSVLKKSAASGGNWKESDLKESGIKTREYLRKYNANE